ncbi:hypothetical protein FACS1894140_0890 [Spirochaetia bacterium]|nr:hypothetical protein FACS1894140_0890 [Spirochaetia bacterium]
MVRESLAGRCAIIELYPLTLPELETADWTEPVRNSLFQRYLIDLEKARGEGIAAAEIYKQIRCACAPGQLFHLRTHDGFEVDLLLELPQGYVAFEIKMAERKNITALHGAYFLG